MENSHSPRISLPIKARIAEQRFHLRLSEFAVTEKVVHVLSADWQARKYFRAASFDLLGEARSAVCGFEPCRAGLVGVREHDDATRTPMLVMPQICISTTAAFTANANNCQARRKQESAAIVEPLGRQQHAEGVPFSGANDYDFAAGAVSRLLRVSTVPRDD